MRNLIDVNNNTALTGSLAAEINQYRRELRQKDELIRDLSGTNNTVRFRESRDVRDVPLDVYSRHNHTHYSEAIPYFWGWGKYFRKSKLREKKIWKKFVKKLS